MMLDIILGITLSFVLLCFWGTGRSAVHASDHMVLSMRLPSERREEPEVNMVIRQYKRAMNWMLAVGAAGIFLVCSATDWEIVLMFAWIVALLISYGRIYQTYVGKMYRLKMERGWTIGKTHFTILVDTVLSGDKDQQLPAWQWGLLPVILEAVALGIYLVNPGVFVKEGLGRWGISILEVLVFTALLLIMRQLFIKKRNKVYSESSEENLKLNRFEKRGFSILAYGVSAAASLGLLGGILAGLAGFWNLGLILTNGVGGLSLAAAILGFYLLQRNMNRLVSEVPRQILVDEDYYWRKGYYCNPNDPAYLVTKRTGVGMEMNMAHKGPAIIVTAFTAAVLIFVFWLAAVPVIRLQGTDFTMEEKNGVVEILSPSYPSSFSLDQVEKWKMVETGSLKGRRTNGLGTGSYSIGHFSSDQMGKGMWYIHRKSPETLLIYLKDGTHIAINQKTEEGTETLLRQLEEWLPQRDS